MVFLNEAFLIKGVHGKCLKFKGVAAINMSWVEFFSKINKLFGTIISDSRVHLSWHFKVPLASCSFALKAGGN